MVMNCSILGLLHVGEVSRELWREKASSTQCWRQCGREIPGCHGDEKGKVMISAGWMAEGRGQGAVRGGTLGTGAERDLEGNARGSRRQPLSEQSRPQGLCALFLCCFG